MMKSEIQSHADFTTVRYANCWEDADILIKALDPNGRHCLSIGSAGDNSFALLGAGAESVTVSEMNPAQVACIHLRKAAYATLSYKQFLCLLGESGSAAERVRLYRLCEPKLPDEVKSYWDHYSEHISQGFSTVGKFESYFNVFRNRCLPWVHGKEVIAGLLEPRSPVARGEFYEKSWDSWRWRLMFRLFFSRFVMGRLGRDPAFFKYVEGSVAERILARAKHALVVMDPSLNPYLQWILTGRYGETLPYALREENYERIAQRVEQLHICPSPIEAVLSESSLKFDAYNLSDIFEYMSEENMAQLLEKIHEHSNCGARLAYWNMLAPRARPDSLSQLFDCHVELGEQLFAEDKAFFYSKFIVEEVI